MTYNTIKIIEIDEASKVRTMTIILVLFLVVSSMGTSFTSLRDVAKKKIDTFFLCLC